MVYELQDFTCVESYPYLEYTDIKLQIINERHVVTVELTLENTDISVGDTVLVSVGCGSFKVKLRDQWFDGYARLNRESIDINVQNHKET